MSVYTTIEPDELVEFLSFYNVGELKDYQGISDGIENTNYFVNTQNGRFVLTIFETHNIVDMQYYLGLMHHLADHKVPSADPVADMQGNYLRIFKDKPIALVKRLNGSSIIDTDIDHCAQIGNAMGQMHSAGLSYSPINENSRGFDWFEQTHKQLQSKLNETDLITLSDEILFQQTSKQQSLPRGVVHADLFRDNTLWDNNSLSGIIDFYYACDDVLLYDLAVTVNDWCCNDDFSLSEDKTCALISAYNKQRTLTEEEHTLWPTLLRRGALRFWLSRLYDKHFPRAGEIVHTKNPDEFKAILSDRINNQQRYLTYWK